MVYLRHKDGEVRRNRGCCCREVVKESTAAMLDLDEKDGRDVGEDSAEPQKKK